MLQSGSGFKSIILKRYYQREKRISEFIVDETLLKVGLEFIRLWVAIEPNNKQILTLSIFKGKQHAYCWKFFVRCSKDLWKASSINRRWNLVPNGLQVSKTKTPCSFLIREKPDWKNYAVHKDRTESFDDYFPCRKENCKLKHVLNWMNLFVSYITRRWFSLKLTGPFPLWKKFYSCIFVGK